MTLYDFAHAHPILAVFLALLAFTLPVTLLGLIMGRPRAAPKYSAADRGALNEGAARLRQAARRFGEEGYSGTESKAVDVAEQLERMAAR